MEYYCKRCHKLISEDVFKYSKENFSVPLCREHQPTPQARDLGRELVKYGHNVQYEKYDGFKHIDIAIVDKKVNIEVDGNQHHGKEQALRDLKRTFYSWEKSYVTLRIPNSLTRDDETIKETAKYIDKFLRTERNQLKTEIINESTEEENMIWKDATNFVNNFIGDFSKAISDVKKSWNNISKSFKI